jgi:hypothetical protein
MKQYTMNSFFFAIVVYTMAKTMKRKVKRGGCGCNSASTTPPPPLPPGGQLGGNSFSMRNYYGAENYDNAPTNPSAIVSARNLPPMQSGGKSRRFKNKKGRKTKRKRSKKMKKMIGGDALLANSMSTNPVLSIGNLNWASSGSNILNNTQNLNPAPYSQPVEKMYGSHNAPLA